MRLLRVTPGAGRSVVLVVLPRALACADCRAWRRACDAPGAPAGGRASLAVGLASSARSRATVNAAGMVRVSRDALPLTVRVVLDDAAADALGWPSALTVLRDGARLRVLAEPGGRSTWAPRSGGVAVTARLSLPGRMLGTWAAELDAGGALVLDTAGPDAARQAA